MPSQWRHYCSPQRGKNWSLAWKSLHITMVCGPPHRNRRSISALGKLRGEGRIGKIFWKGFLVGRTQKEGWETLIYRFRLRPKLSRAKVWLPYSWGCRWRAGRDASAPWVLAAVCFYRGCWAGHIRWCVMAYLCVYVLLWICVLCLTQYFLRC